MTQKKVLPIELARFRLGVLFPLLCRGQNLERGAQAEILRQIAQTSVVCPGEDYPRFISERTLLRWLSEVRKTQLSEPAQALLRLIRSDRGKTRRLTSEQKEWLRSNRESYPRWTYALHADNLQHTGLLPQVSRSSVYRWMKAEGLRPTFLRGGAHNKKATMSFEAEFPGQICHLDFHTSATLRVLGDCGSWLKPKCVAFIDDRSRFGLHLQWFLGEAADELVHAKIQSYLKYGIHWRDMSDNGSAMISAEFERGLRQLGCGHIKTAPKSPYQNGKIESFWGPLEGRLMAMLTNVKPLTLEFLNEASIAWMEQDYNCRFHSEIKATPRSLWFSTENVARRPAPSTDELRRLFRRKATRRQRFEDHTISLEGVRYQLPKIVWGTDNITLAYASWNRDLVTIIDPETERELVDIFPVDRQGNAERLTSYVKRPGADSPEATRENEESQALISQLPPLLAHLIEEHRMKWLAPGVVPKPDFLPFKESEK